MSTINVIGGTVVFYHSVTYFEKGIDERGPYYDVEYQIDDWSQSDAFCNALEGIGTGQPHRHPLSNNLICTSAHCTGRGRSGADNSDGLPNYLDGAKIKATYRSIPLAYQGGMSNITLDDPEKLHQIDPSTPLVWCTQELDFESETISLPNTHYTWEADGSALDSPVQKDLSILVLNLTFFRRPALPVSLVRSLRGRINSATFLGAAAELVWFVGAKTSRDSSVDGSVTEKVQYMFKEREVSWNKNFNPKTGAWDYFQDGGSNRRFPTANLNPLVAI